MSRHFFTQKPLWPLLLLGLFLCFTFLSFTATSYALPWTNLGMEAFAFLAVLALFFGLPLQTIRLRLDAKCYFLVFCLLAATVSEFLSGSGLHENFVLTVLYLSTALMLCSLPIAENPKLISAYLLTIVLAAMFNAVVICAQQWDAQASLPFTSAAFDATKGIWPFGNFGQPNLAASLILTGILCSLYFQAEGKLHWSLHTCVLALCALGLAFSASRTAFLALLILLLLSVLRRDWRGLASFFWVGIVIVLARFLSAGPSRVLINKDFSSGRFDLWQIVLDGLSHSPWFGYGAMNTRVAQFTVADLHVFTKNNAIGSSHNIFLDLFVWFGIPLGLVASLLLVRLFWHYISRNKKSSILYLLIPLTVHSLLEYPLYNASFLFLFVFILQISTPIKLDQKQSKALACLFFIISLTLAFIVSYDYIRLARNYNDLRFFNNRIVGVDKPPSLQPMLLDITIGQYNAFLVEKIEMAKQLHDIEELTPYSPSFKNFFLLAHYYQQHGTTEQYAYWLKKADAYLSEPYMLYVRSPAADGIVLPLQSASAVPDAASRQ